MRDSGTTADGRDARQALKQPNGGVAWVGWAPGQRYMHKFRLTSSNQNAK